MEKYSKQRQMILNVVMENHIHPTADLVYHMLKPENPDLSLGTVYRNLNLLAKQGKIRKLKMSDGPDRFDGNTRHHYHMKCKRCGELVDLHTDYIKSIDQDISSTTGVKILSHEIEFEGICDKCDAHYDEH